MKASKLIIGAFADMRSEGRHCAGVGSLQLGEGFEIALRRGVFVLLDTERLEGRQSLGPAPQHQIAHRSAPELLERLCFGGEVAWGRLTLKEERAAVSVMGPRRGAPVPTPSVP